MRRQDAHNSVDFNDQLPVHENIRAKAFVELDAFVGNRKTASPGLNRASEPIRSSAGGDCGSSPGVSLQNQRRRALAQRFHETTLIHDPTCRNAHAEAAPQAVEFLAADARR